MSLHERQRFVRKCFEVSINDDVLMEWEHIHLDYHLWLMIIRDWYIKHKLQPVYLYAIIVCLVKFVFLRNDDEFGPIREQLNMLASAFSNNQIHQQIDPTSYRKQLQKLNDIYKAEMNNKTYDNRITYELNCLQTIYMYGLEVNKFFNQPYPCLIQPHYFISSSLFYAFIKHYNTKNNLVAAVDALFKDAPLILNFIDNLYRRISLKHLKSPEPSVSYTSSTPKRQSLATKQNLQPTTYFTEHVQLVKNPTPINCIIVESASNCCSELVGLRLEYDDESFVEKGNTSLQGMTFKRNINVYVGALGVTLPENNELQIISFKGSFDCISKVLSIKDKLIYLIMSNGLGKSVVPLIHKHRCIENIYIVQNTDDQKPIDWIRDYSKIRTNGSSVDLLLKQIKQDIDSLMHRPSRWSRSKNLLTELCFQTSQTDPLTSINDTLKEDVSKSRIVTIFFGGRQLFSQSQAHIPIDEFNNIDECIQSIKDHISIAVFLIIFTDGFDNMYSLFELDVVHAVYIVRKSNYNEQIETMSRHSKVSGVFDLDMDLFEQLTTDICFYRHMQVHTPTINTFHIGTSIIDNPNSKENSFLFFQLFSDILPHIPTGSNTILGSNTEIANQLFPLLIDANITINNLLNQFDNSTLQTSISQLQKINQCTTLLSKPTDSSSVTVYRAQLVSKKDLDLIRNSPNTLLSIPTFILASRSFHTVTDICRRALDNQLTVILFELNLSENMSIANLDSDRVIFSLGTLFRLISAESAVDGVWHAQLESADSAMQIIKEELQSKIGGRLTWLTFGNYLAYLKQFNAAKEYYQYLLHLLPDNNPNLVSIYNNMGLIYSAMNENQEALNWFEKAASFKLPDSSMITDEESSSNVESLLPQDSSIDGIAILNKMAEMSYRLGDRQKARDFYRQALEIVTDVDSQKFYHEKIQNLSFLDENFQT